MNWWEGEVNIFLKPPAELKVHKKNCITTWLLLPHLLNGQHLRFSINWSHNLRYQKMPLKTTVIGAWPKEMRSKGFPITELMIIHKSTSRQTLLYFLFPLSRNIWISQIGSQRKVPTLHTTSVCNANSIFREFRSGDFGQRSHVYGWRIWSKVCL